MSDTWLSPDHPHESDTWLSPDHELALEEDDTASPDFPDTEDKAMEAEKKLKPKSARIPPEIVEAQHKTRRKPYKYDEDDGDYGSS